MFDSSTFKMKGYIKFLASLIVLASIFLTACAGAQAKPEPTQPSATPEPTMPAPTSTPTEEMVTPSVSVMDQEISNGTVMVPEVVSDGQGWIVIHADQDNAPGEVIGHAAVSDGDNENVSVEIDIQKATEQLWAMLHTDSGEMGTYEFPGGDPPVMLNGEIVMEPFMVTGMPVTPSVTVTDQEVDQGTITVPEVVSDGPGWIVIHQEENGSPGMVIGHAAVVNGVNENVSVDIDASMATQTLFAMLHTDSGQMGTYEFPDGDPPVQVDGQIVVKPFELTGGLPASVIVRDQTLEDSTVTVKQVFSAVKGWIVIHADQDDAPGPVIGHAAVEAGFNQDVTVEVDTGMVTDTLWAMLHEDTGEEDVYEFPGGDPPVRVNDQIVVQPFEVQGGGTTAAEQVTIAMVGTQFDPKEISIPAGTTVVWENQSTLPHTVTADDGSFDSGTVSPGGTFEVTFSQAGEVPFHCEFHGAAGGVGMSGTITVTSP
jgi:plastocyanin/Cu/Zn superoxide dismutase